MSVLQIPLPTGYDAYRATDQFGSLDGLRFLCIAAVLWHHSPLSAAMSESSVLFTRGRVGVDFFFVLSGFLITTLLLRERAARGRISLSGFYRRRALRILPVYYLVVTLAAFNEIVLNGKTESLALLPYYYFFLANFLVVEDIVFLDPTWSLSVEEQYYLIWPILLMLIQRRWVVPVLAVMILINVAAAMELFSRVGIHAIVLGQLRLAIRGVTYAPILMGSLVAVVLHSPKGFSYIAPLLRSRMSPWICFVLLMAVLVLLPERLEGWPNLIVHSLMTAMLVSLVVREDNSMASLMKLPALARIGRISYGIYLYHLFAHGIVAVLLASLGFNSPILFFIAYLALSVLLAEISFRTLETWFMSRRYRPVLRSSAGESQH